MPTATSFESGQDIIRNYFTANWSSTPSSALLYILENDKFDGSDPNVDYMEFCVRENDSIQVTCGPTARYRVLGTVVGIIRGRIDDGAGKVRGYADSLANLFRNLLLDNISFHAPKIIPVGRDETHYRVNVIIPFKYDFVATR